MTNSALLALDLIARLLALFVIGSIRWFALVLFPWSESSPAALTVPLARARSGRARNTFHRYQGPGIERPRS